MTQRIDPLNKINMNEDGPIEEQMDGLRLVL